MLHNISIAKESLGQVMQVTTVHYIFHTH